MGQSILSWTCWIEVWGLFLGHFNFEKGVSLPHNLSGSRLATGRRVGWTKVGCSSCLENNQSDQPTNQSGPETVKVQPVSCTHLHPAHLPHFQLGGTLDSHWSRIISWLRAWPSIGPPLVAPMKVMPEETHSLVSTLAAIMSRTDSYLSSSEKGQIPES